jgi:hypothetical protein
LISLRTAGIARALAVTLLAWGVALLAPESVGAQDALVGRVERSDGAGVAGAPVTLHRVTSSSSGAIDSTSTTADGSFRFTVDVVDTATFNVFFATTDHLGVRYFGRPLHSSEGLPSDYRIPVYDTTSALAGATRFVRRDVVLIPEAAGGWEVNEVVRVQNPTSTTLVSRGGMPTWEFRIPMAATDFEAGEGDVAPNEVMLMADRVLLLTPLLPGDRELFVRYRIPAGGRSLDLRAETALDTMNLFLRQPSPAVTVEGLTTTEIIDAGEERFLRYGGVDLSEGSVVGIRWSGPTAPPIRPVTAGVLLTLLGLGVGVWAALRNRRTPADRLESA